MPTKTTTTSSTALAPQPLLESGEGYEWPVLALLTDQWRKSNGFPVRNLMTQYFNGDLYEASVQGDEFVVEITRDDAVIKEANTLREKLERELAPAIRNMRNGAEAVATSPNPRNKKGYEVARAKAHGLEAQIAELKAVAKKQTVARWPMSVFSMRGL